MTPDMKMPPMRPEGKSRGDSDDGIGSGVPWEWPGI